MATRVNGRRPHMVALVFDTETTGLLENRSMPLDRLPEVIEFFGMVVDLDTGKKRSEYHTMIRPQRPFQEQTTVGSTGRKKKGTTEITGITNRMLEDAPPFSDVAERIFSVVEGAPAVVAHNASFDVEMLDIEAERCGRRIAWPRVVCTVEQTIHYLGYRLNLQGLHEHLLGESFSGAHRARTDVEALTRCCVEMRRRGDL